jgi:hypothetical protein
MLTDSLAMKLRGSMHALQSSLLQPNSSEGRYLILSTIFLLLKMRLSLWDQHSLCVSFLVNFWIPEPILMKAGTYVNTFEPISTTYFMNPSHQSACLHVYPPPLLINGSVKTLP